MEAAAWRLSTIDRPLDARLVPIHFLTGRRFWFQTAFCISTYAGVSDALPPVVFHDDGTLSTQQEDFLQQLVPGSRVVTISEGAARVDSKLPATDFPILRSQWQAYINIRKLIDVHLQEGSWKLVLDSDMLFFTPPSELRRWQENPEKMVVMRDVKSSYGYSNEALDELAGGPVPGRINVGICGLNSHALNWTDLEFWASELIGRYGTSYYLEQALVALLAKHAGYHMLDQHRYRLQHLMPDQADTAAVMCHFVDRAKPFYFQRAWRDFEVTQGA